VAGLVKRALRNLRWIIAKGLQVETFRNTDGRYGASVRLSPFDGPGSAGIGTVAQHPTRRAAWWAVARRLPGSVAFYGPRPTWPSGLSGAIAPGGMTFDASVAAANTRVYRP
jgi:hypothetical protein